MRIRFYNARILETKEDETFAIREGELWTQDDRIAYIGPAKECPADTVWDREIDCRQNLLMQGFKNAHTHTAMTFLRTYADDLPLNEWLFNKIFPKEAQLTADQLYYLDVLGIMEYLTSGITANFDMYYFRPMNAKASLDCGFRTVQCGGLNDFGGTVEDTEEDFLRMNELGDLHSYILGFHAESTTSLENMKGIAALAQKYHTPVWMHNSETEADVKACFDRYGKSPTEITDELGMYEYGGGGFHCVWFSDKDIEIFKKRGMYVVTNPGSNAKLASGIAPLKRFVDAGIPVAIGTDGPSSNNALDMFREMYLASVLAKLKENDAACISAEKILYMAAVTGAHAMNLPDCDRLAEGKKADLIMINLHQPNMQPENDIVKNLVYSGSKQNVKLTMVNGKILYEDQKFHIGFDPEEIYRRANEIIRSMD